MEDRPVVADHLSTLEVARILGQAVRSVQLMVDRGELDAWKTSGGHRRISRAPTVPKATRAATQASVKVLLIEDSIHYQNMVGLLLKQKFPQVELRTAGDGIVGLIMVGQYQPDVLIVDILLPGIDGATLISSLRMHAQFRNLRVIVVTSLTPEQRSPYAFALQDVPVVYKPNLVTELPEALSLCLKQEEHAHA